MGNIYSVRFSATFSAQMDFFEVTPADDKPLALHAVFLGQTSDVGDAASENVPIRIAYLESGYGSGSGGSTPNLHKFDHLSPTPGFTSYVANTTLASSGLGAEPIFDDVWNINIGYQVWFPEGLRPVIRQGEGLVVRSITAPADSLDLYATLIVEEL